MKGIKQLAIIFLIIVILSSIIVNCGDRQEPITKTQYNLAPSTVDYYVYINPTTMQYHFYDVYCVNIDDEIMLISEALGKGYKPCPKCFPAPEPPHPKTEPHVYILPQDHEYYHIFGCPNLTEDKIIILETTAKELGYKPCLECAIPKYISGRLVYICPVSGVVYHGAGCTYLEQCKQDTMKAIPLWKLSSMLNPNNEPYKPCSRCNGQPYNAPGQ